MDSSRDRVRLGTQGQTLKVESCLSLRRFSSSRLTIWFASHIHNLHMETFSVTPPRCCSQQKNSNYFWPIIVVLSFELTVEQFSIELKVALTERHWSQVIAGVAYVTQKSGFAQAAQSPFLNSRASNNSPNKARAHTTSIFSWHPLLSSPLPFSSPT